MSFILKNNQRKKKRRILTKNKNSFLFLDKIFILR